MTEVIQSLPQKFKQFLQSFLEIPRDQLILKLALFFVLTFTTSRWSLHIPLRLLALYMLLDHRFTSNRALWWIQGLGHVVILSLEWDFIDNHKYLSVYWMLVCALSLHLRTMEERLEMISINARMLIGLCFALATAWKIFGGQYLDGSFLHYTFLTDGRFEYAVGYITNITREHLPANQGIIKEMMRFPHIRSHEFLRSPSFIRDMALYVSWWTLLIEGLVAVGFLVRASSWFGRARHAFLMVFILSTYTFVPVAGFNYILVLLGLSELKTDQKKWAWAYMGALFISEFKKLPTLKYYLYLKGL